MEFVKGFRVGDGVILEGQEIEVVLSDGETFSNVILTTASSKKLGVQVEGEKGERVFDVKEVLTIK